MLVWFAGLSIVIVWQVFRDPAVDYRLVMAGAVAPDVVEVVTGGHGVAHSLVASAALLVVVMVATRGRRGLRRRLLALPVGALLHLVLDAAWTEAELFWWPLLGWEPAGDAPPSLHRPVVVLALQEATGLAALAWWWRRFRLDERERRRVFVRTGRVGRDLVS